MSKHGILLNGSESSLSLSVAVIGAGAISAAPQLLASLANYFGERPLEVRLYDADAERLELMARLAKSFWELNKCQHELLMTTDLEEALAESHKVIWMPDANCLRKSKGALDLFHVLLPQEADVLLIAHEAEPAISGFWTAEWPAPITEQEELELPLQLLRWVRSEEYPWALLKQFEKNPVNSWLDNPSTLDFVP